MNCLLPSILFLTRHLKSSIQFIGLLFIFISLSACEVLPINPPRIPTYGDYYLWLKSLDNEALLQEIERQKTNKQVKSPDADIYIMLLHSLPESPIYNPYTAKSILNKLELQYVESRYNPTNLALITLLRDLLNEQLLTIESHSDFKIQLKNANKMLVSLKEKVKIKDEDIVKHKNEIFDLNQALGTLKKQIELLQRIENNINQHGQ